MFLGLIHLEVCCNRVSSGCVSVERCLHLWSLVSLEHIVCECECVNRHVGCLWGRFFSCCLDVVQPAYPTNIVICIPCVRVCLCAHFHTNVYVVKPCQSLGFTPISMIFCFCKFVGMLVCMYTNDWPSPKKNIDFYVRVYFVDPIILCKVFTSSQIFSIFLKHTEFSCDL